MIISRGGNATRLERQAFPDEAALQAYLSAHPQAIPISDSEEQPRLHVLGREFPTSSGPIDILGTDEGGEPYIIETKLYKNSDKRTVLAQVLDYGAALWTTEPDTATILSALRQGATRRGDSEPLSALATFLGADDESAMEHLERVRNALSQGRFTAIVLMDRLEDRLRDLILFMNENSNFRLLAAELDYYRHEDTEFVCPRLFGAQARPAARASRSSRTAQVPAAEFFADYARDFGTESVALWKELEAALLSSGIVGMSIGHRPRGTPYAFLANSSIGELHLFHLASNSQVRDSLHYRSDAILASATAATARVSLREAFLATVPGAAIEGSVGRVYMPLHALVGAKDTVLVALQRFADAVGAL